MADDIVMTSHFWLKLEWIYRNRYPQKPRISILRVLAGAYRRGRIMSYLVDLRQW